jgi:hypothetical protein
MIRNTLTSAAVMVGVLMCNLAMGQEQLVLNGNFETIARNEMQMPILDAYGNEQAVDWFRALDGNPPPAGVPKTELITNDSNGTGTNSAAMNPPPGGGSWPTGQDPHSDWRSENFATTPGEVLKFSFDFKFIDVVQAPGFQEFRLDLRSFNDEAGSIFTTESLLFVSTAGYRYNYVDSDPNTGTQTLSVTEDFSDEQWHTIALDWVVPGIVTGHATDGNFSDVRVSINAFTTLIEGQVRIDNVSVIRPVPGDYNENGIVDAADYVIWRGTNGSTTDLRANGDDTGASMGVIDQADYNFWRANFGNGATGAGAALSGSVVPEPSTALQFLSLAAAFAIRYLSRQRVIP